MHVLQVIKNNQAWIVAISSDIDKITKYKNEQSIDSESQFIQFQIPFNTYPFIILETEYDPNKNNGSFDFFPVDKVESSIQEFIKNKNNPDDYVYISYHFIYEDYFQENANINLMHLLNRTEITNHELKNHIPLSIFNEQVKKYTFDYNIDGLDELFEQTKTNTISEKEKVNLAINGYEKLFWYLLYDFDCGKLTEHGIELLLPMVAKIELLLGKKQWKLQSIVQKINLEHLCNTQPGNTALAFSNTISALRKQLINNPEEKEEIHYSFSSVYSLMIHADPVNAMSHWENALQEIYQTTHISPELVSWISIFKLLHTPLPNKKTASKNQIDAQYIFQHTLANLEKKYGLILSYSIANAYKLLEEHLSQENLTLTFPKSIALYWTEKSLKYNPEIHTVLNIREVSSFFEKTGIKYKRVDLLLKAISIFEYTINRSKIHPFEVYYTANTWKHIAEIYIKNNNQEKGDEAMHHAIITYKTNTEQIKLNTSTHLHYAEFLEYCYAYKGNIEKPTVCILKTIAKEIEIESDGYLSAPYILFMKIALHQEDEQQAIVELTKSLILHELCIQDLIISLIEKYKNSTFNKLVHFLNASYTFMMDSQKNYYYSPEIKWNDLNQMSADEILNYWENRKTEIINRN